MRRRTKILAPPDRAGSIKLKVAKANPPLWPCPCQPRLQLAGKDQVDGQQARDRDSGALYQRGLRVKVQGLLGLYAVRGWAGAGPYLKSMP